MKCSLKKIFILLAIAVSMANADKTVAVLEIIPSGEQDLTIQKYRILTDELRRRAIEALPQSYTILTRDSIISLMLSDSEEAECLDENCAVDIGRAISSEYVTQGFVGKSDEKLTLTVELYESINGKLLGSFVAESKNAKGLIITIREKSSDLFAKIPKNAAANTVKKEKKEEKKSIVKKTASSDQDMKLGVRAGFNLLDFSFGEDYLNESVEMGYGFGVGLAAIVPISREISFRTGAELHYRKVSFGETDVGDWYASEFVLSVPAIVQYSFGDAWAGAGLQVEIPFGSEVTVGDNSEDFVDRSLADFGFAISGGYNITDNIGVDLKIILGISALSNTEYIEDSSIWQYGIGATYFF